MTPLSSSHQLTSDGVLKSGTSFPSDYLHIFRFNSEGKITSTDSWNVSPIFLAASSCRCTVRHQLILFSWLLLLLHTTRRTLRLRDL